MYVPIVVNIRYSRWQARSWLYSYKLEARITPDNQINDKIYLEKNLKGSEKAVRMRECIVIVGLKVQCH